jgi:hypothetical protein
MPPTTTPVTTNYQLWLPRRERRHRADPSAPIYLIPPNPYPNYLAPNHPYDPPQPDSLPYTDAEGNMFLCPFMFWGVSHSLNGSYSTTAFDSRPCVVGESAMSLIAWYRRPGDGPGGKDEIDVDAYSDESNTFDTTDDLAPLSGAGSIEPPAAREAPADDDVISTAASAVTLTADPSYSLDPAQLFEQWLVFGDGAAAPGDDVLTETQGASAAAIATYHDVKKNPPVPSKDWAHLVLVDGDDGWVLGPGTHLPPHGGPGPLPKVAQEIVQGLAAYLTGAETKNKAEQKKGLATIGTAVQEGEQHL